MSDRIRLSDIQRDAVLREAGYRCANPVCHTTLALDVHHIVEVHANGGNELANLLALCPTCHALFHRGGVISREAIVQWKKRLQLINSVPGLAEAFVGAERNAPTFRSAAAEFSFRACPVGFMRDSRFFKRGIATFIDEKLAITPAAVSSLLFARGSDGLVVFQTQRGPAPCILEGEAMRGIAFLRMGPVDDSHFLAVVTSEVAPFFSEPLQTRVRYRLRPFPGDPVGLLHLPGNTFDIRGPGEFQFERCVVAFANGLRNSPGAILEHSLSPLPTRVADLGAPVFTDDSRLVGITSGLQEVKGELGWRPIVEGLIALHVKKYPYDP